MLVVENTILSDDIFEKYFLCDLSSCKGICCVEGDAGAPLEENEIHELEEIMEAVSPYMTKKGAKCVKQNGVFDYDEDATLVTPLVDNKECAFVYFENDIAKCAIEKAFLLGKVNFRKPISCHLYPIRILSYQHYDALNYHPWNVCKDACLKGEKQKVTIFEFLKEPLIRKYGEAWYEKVADAIEEREQKIIEDKDFT